VLLDAEGIGSRRILTEPIRPIPATGEIGVARESQPDLMRRLRPDLVKLESRDQTDHAARHSLGGLDQRKVVVAVEVQRGVESASELTHLLLYHEAAKVFPRVIGRDHVTGTKNPEAADVVASLHESGAFVTFCAHLFIYGMIS
jgi:hypothetical protein